MNSISKSTPTKIIATQEEKTMTIQFKSVRTPIKESNPTLYARHVKHFTRAKAFTYNYYRSEEHTSELQSRLHIVCRLLLAKKKQKTIKTKKQFRTNVNYRRAKKQSNTKN